MTSATEELRRLLDERGVAHYDGTESTLWLMDEHGYRASADELSSGRLSVHIWCDTPEQAIAATLGDEPKSMRVFDSMETALAIAEKEVEIEQLKRENAELCDENAELTHRRDELEAVTLGNETCKYDETEIIPVIRIFAKDTFANDPLGERIHVLECTVCGGTYEHVNGDYEYCPRCGRRCEGEQTWSV